MMQRWDLFWHAVHTGKKKKHVLAPYVLQLNCGHFTQYCGVARLILQYTTLKQLLGKLYTHTSSA